MKSIDREVYCTLSSDSAKDEIAARLLQSPIGGFIARSGEALLSFLQGLGWQTVAGSKGNKLLEILGVVGSLSRVADLEVHIEEQRTLVESENWYGKIQ